MHKTFSKKQILVISLCSLMLGGAAVSADILLKIPSLQAEENDGSAAEKAVLTDAVQRASIVSSLPDFHGKISSRFADVDEEKFEPAPDFLNLACYFPEGEEEGDVSASFAGKLYSKLLTSEAAYFTDICDYIDKTPAAAARSLGISTDTLQGKYDPSDASQIESDPSTHVVNDFRSLHVSFYDGSGNRIDEGSCVREILAMVSVYAYFHNTESFEELESMASELLKKSHSSKVSMGSVYYCGGCSSYEPRPAQPEKQVETEAPTEALPGVSDQDRELLDSLKDEGSRESLRTALNVDSGSVEPETVVTSSFIDRKTVVDAAENVPASSVTPENENPQIQTEMPQIQTEIPQTAPVVSDFNLEMSENQPTPTENTKEERIPSPTSGNREEYVAVESQPAESSPVVAELPENREMTAFSVFPVAAGYDPVNSALSETEDSSGYEEGYSGEDASLPVEGVIVDEASDTPDPAISSRTASRAASGAKNHCPGHVDLYVTFILRGTEGKTTLFDLDEKGGSEASFNEQWQGWTDDKRELVRTILQQDWLTKYGLTISSLSIHDSLTADEIRHYLELLPADLPEDRFTLIECALKSVSRIPYYWGGKPSSGGYEGNSFGTIVSPDYKGRILKGLDCSGWIRWVYWTALGKVTNGLSTVSLAGEGRKIERAELRPGDIIVRPGSSTTGHVVMFLAWSTDGRMIVLHESGTPVNNVTVTEMEANWKHYRSILN